MAAKFETSQFKGSDLVYDVCCTVCADEGINKEGLFYCKKCSKPFCDNCVILHNKIHKDHSVSEKVEGQSWPVSKTTTGTDTLEMCEEHCNAKLEMFCEDHEKLLCNVCLLHNHRQCRSVVLISDKVKSSSWDVDFRRTIAGSELLRKELDKMQLDKEENIDTLEASCERVLQEIMYIRERFNDALDILHQMTIKELETLKTSLLSSLQSDIDKCKHLREKMKVINEVVADIGHIKSERSFIANRQFIERKGSSEILLKGMTKNAGVEFSLQCNQGLAKFMSTCTGLGTIISTTDNTATDPNKAIIIMDKEEFKVKIDTDQHQCYITDICETSDRELIIADYNNCCVKLLDKAYKVTSHCILLAKPWSLCNISSNEVAVNVRDIFTINQIHILSADNGKLIKSKILKLDHSCYGIAHHQGDLFVTSGTALYHYTMDGQLVKELYRTCTGYSVVGLAVSPDGKRIYVTDISSGNLLTLTRDGAVTATLQDPAFKHTKMTCNIHVAGTGQVFVFGNKSISQVDTDGKRILNTISDDRFTDIESVYLSHNVKKLFVGMRNNSIIMLFNTS